MVRQTTGSIGDNGRTHHAMSALPGNTQWMVPHKTKVVLEDTMKRLSLIAAAAMLTPVLASAAPCTAPAFCNDFTALPGATFGGSGIPNDAVAITYGPLLGTFPFQFPSAILGLSAHGNSPGVVTICASPNCSA